MTLQAVLTLSLAVLALEMKPGPGMMMLMSRTIAGGMRACLTYMLGYMIITALYVIVVLWGFQFTNVDIVFVSILIKTLAAVYLIWLGVKGIQSLGDRLTLQELKGESFFDTLSAAMILTASNPLVIVFYAGILPTLIDVSVMNMNDMTIIMSVILFVGGGFPILYCIPIALFRKKMSEMFLRRLKLFSSIVIILVGIYIGASALPSKDVLSLF